jgi:hypothetical protein
MFFLSLFRASEGIANADISTPTTASLVASLEAAVDRVEQDMQLQPVPAATTPAGSTGQIQYNSGFSFAASPLLTYDGVGTLGTSNITGTALAMTITPKAPSVLDLAGDFRFEARNAAQPNTSGGSLSFEAGDGDGTGNGGPLIVSSGGTSGSGNGGDCFFFGGSSAGGTGGAFSMFAGPGALLGGSIGVVGGSASSAGGTGGNVQFEAGFGDGTGGSMIFYAGSNNAGGVGGDITLSTRGSGSLPDPQGTIYIGNEFIPWAIQITDDTLGALIGFFGATPVVQPATGGAAATRVAVASTNIQTSDTFDGYTVAQVVKALRNLGILT